MTHHLETHAAFLVVGERFHPSIACTDHRGLHAGYGYDRDTWTMIDVAEARRDRDGATMLIFGPHPVCRA